MDDTERQARLTAWFGEHGDRLLAYLLHRTDRHSAEDVLQEVFVTAFRRAEDVPEPPVGWLFGTARRVLANSVRAERRRLRLSLRLADAADVAAVHPHDDDPALAEALAGLSAADREVLTLCAWYELTADEAAEALGCSRSAYGVRLHRARRRLAQRLEAAGHPRTIRPEAVHD